MEHFSLSLLLFGSFLHSALPTNTHHFNNTDEFITKSSNDNDNETNLGFLDIL